MVKVDEVTMQEQYEDALEGKTDLNKKIIELNDLNELAC